MAREIGFWKKVGTYITPVFTSGVDFLVRGTNKYINFNSITGESGYGIRDNNGTIEVKSSGGSWSTISTGGGGALPAGGTTGQVLTKKSATDGDADWETVAGTGDMLASVYDPTNGAKQVAFGDEVVKLTGNQTITGVKTFDSSNTIISNLMQINHASGNPEFNFQEGGTTRGKVYYDVGNNRLVFQNNEVNTQDAIYFAEHITTTGNINPGGLVDGRDVAADGLKLDGIETGAEVNTVTLTNSVTLTNKRVNPRTSSNTSTATLTPSLATANVFYLTAQAAALTIAAPTGTPVIGETISINIKDNGTARGLTFNSTFKFIGAAAPTTTTISKWLVVTAQYTGADWLATFAEEV